MDGLIGILHPGAMGISIAAAARAAGNDVAWLPTGRSATTAARAAAEGLSPIDDLREFCARCSMILSVCPPHAAVAVAAQVAAAGFRGLYVDGNAVSPAKARVVADHVTSAGADYVDGGIVGPPAWKRGTCLYVSGPRAAEIPLPFAGSVLEVRALGPGLDTASALKMCYAARTKGTTALLATVLAAADALGVRDDLEARWASEDAALPARIENSVRAAAPKAWRWIDEMHEIAATLRDAGAEGGFHDAATAVYSRLADYKDADPPPEVADVVAALLNGVERTAKV